MEFDHEDPTAGEEVVDTAAGWKPNEDWDAAAEVADAPAPVPALHDLAGAAIADNAMKLNEVLTPVTEPVTEKPLTFNLPSEGDDGPEVGPTPEQIAYAKALLEKVGLGTVDLRQDPVRDHNAPVSDKPIPITLAEEPPTVAAQSRLVIGDMEVIASADKIEYIRRYIDGTTDQEKPAVVNEPPQMNEAIAAHINEEQEAGRRALARQQARAVSHPRLPKTQEELDREKPPVTVFRGGGNEAQQHLLRTAPAPGKGQGI